MTLSSVMNFKRTIDDTGKSVECRSFKAIQRQASRDPALTATADRITAEALTHFSMWHGAAIGASVPLLMIVSDMILSDDPIWLQFVPLVIIVPILGIALGRYHWRKVMPGLTRILIEEGICASCMYPLEGLSEDPEGMLVCPECSASWLRSRVLRFAPIARSSTDRTARSAMTYFLRNMRNGLDRRGIRDHRDSPRAVIALRSIRKIRLDATNYHQKRLDAATQVLKPIGRIKRFMLASSFALVFASLALPLLIISRIGSALPLVAFVPMVLIGTIQLLLAVSVLFSDFGRPSKLVRREFLSRNMCPCCAADLEEQPPENDDRTVCPACGSAWKLAKWDST